jgi:hypothetical protein
MGRVLTVMGMIDASVMTRVGGKIVIDVMAGFEAMFAEADHGQQKLANQDRPPDDRADHEQH